MTQLQPTPVTTGKRKSACKVQPRIDMTPMVDLGFLLITFFIFTTSMAEPHVTKLYMPVDGPPGTLCESCAFTVLLKGSDSVYYYSGKWNEAIKNSHVHLTNYNVNTGLGAIIRQKQKALGDKRNDLMLLIKPLESSSYKNMMNALDEVLINDVKKYAIVEAEQAEKAYVQQGSD